MGNLPAWTKITNPFTGKPFVSEDTIMKALSLVKQGISMLPNTAKERIAVRALKGNQDFSDNYAKSIIKGKPDTLTGQILEQSGLMVSYKRKW